MQYRVARVSGWVDIQFTMFYCNTFLIICFTFCVKSQHILEHLICSSLVG